MKKYEKIIIPISIIVSSVIAIISNINLAAAFGFLLGAYIIAAILTLLISIINKSILKEFAVFSLLLMLLISIISFIGLGFNA